MINYYDVLVKDNQLINILNNYDNSNDYLLFIYFTCCILNGYESIDYLIHLLVSNIINFIDVDLTLYYPILCNIDIKKKLNETIKYYDFYNNEQKDIVNNFINRLNNKKKINQKNIISNKDNILDNLLINTVSLRGFNQYINFGKVFNGNKLTVKNYFINDQDIKILKIIVDKFKNEDIIKIFKLYFQVPQLMHPYNNYKIYRESLYLKYNFCINNKFYNKKNCIKKENIHVTNLITALFNYGDCREMALILEFYYCYKEWNKYLKYLKNFKENKEKIIKLIKNQKRIIDVDIYFSAYNPKYNINTFTNIFDYIPITDTINEKINAKIYIFDNIKYTKYENHNFIVKIKFDINLQIYTYKCYDIMYNKYDLKLINTYFFGDYIINKKKPIIKYDSNNIILDFGSNNFNNDINVIATINKSYFIDYTYNYNLKGKIFFLSLPYSIPNNFYNINEFIINRENKFYFLKKKYFNKYNKVEQYNYNSKNLKYFLLENL